MGIGGRKKIRDGKRRRGGGCLAGFSVVFPSLKAGTRGCFICANALTFSLYNNISPHLSQSYFLL